VQGKLREQKSQTDSATGTELSVEEVEGLVLLLEVAHEFAVQESVAVKGLFASWQLD
jgi:hypothetical protein